ncbi:hypothetical protein GCM10011375_32680 [Hymenobacter qilianensis]|uniref:Uncharacterized protein n=2 Tax=Hymenobacter qilianensis TaxID=1385715 RepID=A0ACB5PV40_9BACT|nr:hypothetical protein [Hymenobacter qilianensis]QNP51448.1 hypothetical protein H9L05_15670 [Hymenobacter qilianensis]GGF75053.1 hypothetical protein GCM10011375_32680 [Hymenobacter qilianensis]
MQLQERECPQCGDPFTGRADKKFCSDACKAQYRRDNLDGKSVNDEEDKDEEWDAENDDWDEDEEEGNVESNMPLYGKVNLSESSPSSITRLEQANEEERKRQFHALEVIRLKQLRIEAQLKQEAAEEAEEEAEKIRTLHSLYSTLIKKCLKLDGQELDEEDLETWIDELDEASEKYLSHPGLREPDNKAHKRLKDLYWLRDTFSDLLTEFHEEGEPVFLELPPKRKARFRTNRIA